jgi:signal transduction histidine kinase
MGGKASDFIGKSISEVFDKASAKEYLKRFRKVIRTDKSFEYEDNIQTPSGDYWFLSNHTRVCSPTGELIGIQVLAHDITERKKMERRLEASAVELRDLTQHLEKVRETERSSIARDLHDDLGQKLTSINMDIIWLKSRIGVQSRIVEKKFQQMQILMNDTIDSIQKISFGLRPSILDDLGLQSAIIWQLREFSKSSGIGVKSFFSPKDQVIDNQISLAIFRIVQEALTNILRHSGASDVEINIKSTKKIIQVLIRDNGKGIEQDQIENNKSFGLIGMRERVKANGGEIKITGHSGTGTEIFVKIPFKKLN